ncbi:MAG TPA: ABC transporter permease [Gammaproteobacteria bacterium]|nr:ABC transporter permease [Gammaproteobacteria bacterium]HDH17305.1 ABC transporter permease [Gammaproteobacteria bacterium]
MYRPDTKEPSKTLITAIIKKEILQLRRDPRLIGLIVVMPLALLILFGVALKLEPQNVKMAVFDGDSSYFSNLIKTGLWSDGYFELYGVNDKQQIVEEIRSGRAKSGLFIGKDFSSLLTENKQPHITFYVDGTMPSLTTAMKYNSNSATDQSVTNDMYFLDENAGTVVIAQDPFIMDTEILFNPDEKETWFFLPGVIGVLIMQIALILTGISVVREREKRTLEQLLVTPMSKTTFIAGKLLPYIFIALIDFYFILAAGWVLFDLPQPSSHLLLFLLAIIYVAVMISLGLLISLISRTQQQAMFLAIFIIVPSILLSGFIFPLEAIPDSVRPISYAIPFTYFVDIIRGLLIKQTQFTDLLPAYASLLFFVFLFITASIIKFRKTI